MSQSEHLCKAIIEQGIHKGKQCERPKMENNYCGKHQKQASIEIAINEGKRKCSTSRCLETFIPITKKTIEYCSSCKKEKEEYSKTITTCTWSENKCSKKAKESGFCGKHEPRALLLKDAKERGIRICDNGKRACRNNTIENKIHCEECLRKDRENDINRYSKRKDTLNMCLGCGKELKELLQGLRGKVQRCSECYEKQRKIEELRERTRNYSEENKANMDKYILSYIQSAKIRNIAFDLTKEKFEELINMPCYYCNSFNEKEVIGIDRINSSMNYTIENCVPCCKICNFMKGTLTKNTFITQAHRIAKHTSVEDIKSEEEKPILLSSNIAPSKVAELYKNGKIHLFIEACVRENRSPLFIEKIKNTPKDMNYNDFKLFFRKCCKADFNLSANHFSHDRKRISLREICAYFNNNDSEHAIQLYESIHGCIDGFKEDMEEIARVWDTLSLEQKNTNLTKVIIKYRNQKAHGREENTSNNSS
jgi:hypothetical protein